MPTYSVTIDEDEDTVLRSWIEEPQDWLEKVVEDMLNQRLNDSLYEQTELNPKKLDKPRKMQEVNKLTLPTWAERQEVNKLTLPTWAERQQ